MFAPTLILIVFFDELLLPAANRVPSQLPTTHNRGWAKKIVFPHLCVTSRGGRGKQMRHFESKLSTRLEPNLEEGANVTFMTQIIIFSRTYEQRSMMESTSVGNQNP